MGTTPGIFLNRFRVVAVILALAVIVCSKATSIFAETPAKLPTLHLPDAKIAEVYRGNWNNTLEPCKISSSATRDARANQHTEPQRPWKVDVNGHYPGWYPGVDVKHQAAAYLACEKNLPLVLQAWDLTKSVYQLADGGIRPMTMYDNPHAVVPETTIDGGTVYYPLRVTASIDFLLLGDMIFRFSQDRDWLRENVPAMRRAAAYIEGWMDDAGLLESQPFDLDQVYRDIDGVAQAAACWSFKRLADLESVAGETERQRHAESVAARLAKGAEDHFWDEDRGYYMEHLVYDNLAAAKRLGSIQAVSSQLDVSHAAAKAIDGVIGIGVDAFGVGAGAAGAHEWTTDHETEGAWIQIGFAEPVSIGGAFLYNRTDPSVRPGERFAEGSLEFSDGSPRVEVNFNRLDVSRAVVSFSPRNVTWVKFTGEKMQGTDGEHAGLAEFQLISADAPYRKITHGMTDTNFAMIAFDVANRGRIDRVWDYFKKHESAFYEVNGLNAPTWIAEKADTYGAAELNKRAPYKDCVAMARTWRYDALMRRRMRDGDGLYKTIAYANALYDRPSGGGAGWFAERYALGRFQPGDEAQATIAKYAEYPAVYNSVIVQETLLGLDVDVWGTIRIDPCVPLDWYQKGFGQEGCGVRKDMDLGYTYRADRVEGWIEGLAESYTIRLRLPPQIEYSPCIVLSEDRCIPYERMKGFIVFTLLTKPGKRAPFVIEASN